MINLKHGWNNWKNILAATNPENLEGAVFNVGNGDNYSVNELADMLGGKKSYGNKVIEPFETLADNSKAKKELLFEPDINLEEGLLLTFSQFK